MDGIFEHFLRIVCKADDITKKFTLEQFKSQLLEQHLNLLKFHLPTLESTRMSNDLGGNVNWAKDLYSALQTNDLTLIYASMNSIPSVEIRCWLFYWYVTDNTQFFISHLENDFPNFPFLKNRNRMILSGELKNASDFITFTIIPTRHFFIYINKGRITSVEKVDNLRIKNYDEMYGQIHQSMAEWIKMNLDISCVYVLEIIFLRPLISLVDIYVNANEPLFNQIYSDRLDQLNLLQKRRTTLVDIVQAKGIYSEKNKSLFKESIRNMNEDCFNRRLYENVKHCLVVGVINDEKKRAKKYLVAAREKDTHDYVTIFATVSNSKSFIVQLDRIEREETNDFYLFSSDADTQGNIRIAGSRPENFSFLKGIVVATRNGSDNDLCASSKKNSKQLDKISFSSLEIFDTLAQFDMNTIMTYCDYQKIIGDQLFYDESLVQKYMKMTCDTIPINILEMIVKSRKRAKRSNGKIQ